MTLRLILGVDPGQTGCVAALADGMPVGFVDMPTWTRKAGGRAVDPYRLASALRELLARHVGAYPLAVFEQVSAWSGQGVSSSFRFGQADGIARGVMARSASGPLMCRQAPGSGISAWPARPRTLRAPTCASDSRRSRRP